MTAKRTLLAVVCASVLGGAASAQTPLFGGRTSAPGGLSTRPTVPPPAGTTSSVLPLIPPRAESPQPFSPTQTTQPGAPAVFPTDTAATDVLTAPQGGVPGGNPAIPVVPGAAYSPWAGDAPAGLMSGHGPITYELYVRTGPSFNVGGGELSSILDHGWMTAGGGRTLFFNASNDAAWVLDLGLSFTQNRGPALARRTQVLASELRGGDVNNTFTLPAGIRAVRRTSFNFGVGRDWWMYGPGTVADTPGFGNWRGGFDIGGRWGTSSIDLELQDDPGGVAHRQAVYHGVYVGSTLNWERQFGAVILQAGVRAEWGYDWMNLLPPQASDLHSVNCLMVFALRY